MTREFAIGDITIKESVSNVTARSSRRGVAGVQVCWHVAGTTKRFDVERDSEDEARSAAEKKFREFYAV